MSVQYFSKAPLFFSQLLAFNKSNLIFNVIPPLYMSGFKRFSRIFSRF